jgi:hypothetical protein
LAIIQFPLLVLTNGVFALALRPTPRRKFGLRDLFVIKTIMAVVAGGLVVFVQFAVSKRK